MRQRCLLVWGVWLCSLCICGSIRAENVPGRDTYDPAWADSLKTRISGLLQDELLATSQLGLSVYDLTSDTALYAYNARQRMRPASTEKLVTAITALSELGAGHRFSTRLYFTGEVRDGVLWGDFYAVGGFDPCFGEEDLEYLVDAVEEMGVDSVAGRLYADVSMKDTLQWGWGWCWDDDMPVLTPLLYERKDDFLEAWGGMLRARGIGFVSVGKARCPSDAVWTAQCGHTLEDILPRMMKESDNLYAESVFYQLAAQSGKPYASREEALYPIERLIGGMGYDPGHYVVADGSGVSLYNYLSAELEVAFLRYAYHNREVFPALYAALPIAGTDGTLRRRMKKGKAHGNVRAKTGTLEGVSTLAGYATARNGHRLAFCIMNQGVSSLRAAQAFQDRLCELLCR